MIGGLDRWLASRATESLVRLTPEKAAAQAMLSHDSKLRLVPFWFD